MNYTAEHIAASRRTENDAEITQRQQHIRELQGKEKDEKIAEEKDFEAAQDELKNLDNLLDPVERVDPLMYDEIEAAVKSKDPVQALKLAAQVVEKREDRRGEMVSFEP